MILKYVLTSKGTVPDYVEDGGYFLDPDDDTEMRIGKAVSSGIPPDAPETTTIVSKSDLLIRVQSIMGRFPEEHPNGNMEFPIDTRSAVEVVDDWCIQVGLKY